MKVKTILQAASFCVMGAASVHFVAACLGRASWEVFALLYVAAAFLMSVSWFAPGPISTVEVNGETREAPLIHAAITISVSLAWPVALAALMLKMKGDR
jgi:hypothetical protein